MTATPSAITTIGELLAFYEQHHVVFLKSWKGAAQRLHRYAAPCRPCCARRSGDGERPDEPALST